MSTSGSMRARIGEVVPLLDRLAAERSTTPEALFAAACTRFKADPKARAARFGLRVLLSQLEQWVDDVPALGSSETDSALEARTKERRELDAKIGIAERDADNFGGSVSESNQKLAREALPRLRARRAELDRIKPVRALPNALPPIGGEIMTAPDDWLTRPEVTPAAIASIRPLARATDPQLVAHAQEAK